MQNHRRVTGDTVIDDDAVRFETDADLGIGEPDEHDAAQASLDMLLNNPQIAQLIDAAVAQRLATMGAPPPSMDTGLMAVVAGIERLTTMHAAQLPGYSKPLPAVEIEKRADGFIQMNALIDRYKAESNLPRYRLVGQPLFAGEIPIPEGSEIETALYPNENMAPLNEPARLVHEAMMQWIGGPQKGIGQRVAEAEAERRGNRLTPESGPFAAPGLPDQSPVRVVAAPPEDMTHDPRRPPQAPHEAAAGLYRV